MFWTWWVQLQAKMQSHLVESALGKARTPRCKGSDYMGCISLLHHKGLACKFLFATKFTLIGPRPQRDQAGVDSAYWCLRQGRVDQVVQHKEGWRHGLVCDRTRGDPRLEPPSLDGRGACPSLTATWRTQTAFHSCHSRSRQTLLLATFLPSAQGSFLPSSSES